MAPHGKAAGSRLQQHNGEQPFRQGGVSKHIGGPIEIRHMLARNIFEDPRLLREICESRGRPPSSPGVVAPATINMISGCF